jgi:hypothetical protein
LSGSLYRAGNGFYYIHGRRPIGNDYTEEVFKRTTEGWDEKSKTIVKVPYEWTEYISLLSSDDVINLFIEEISKSSVIIKDAEFLLKKPIITTGLIKVFLDNCIVQLEKDTGFLQIDSIGTGEENFELKEYYETLDKVVSGSSKISRNSILGHATYYKYGSRYGQPQIKRHWPENTEYHLKVDKQDKIIESGTDKRGYPQSCGIENREKGITVIVHNEELGKGRMKLGCDDRIIGVSSDENVIVLGSSKN